MHDLGTVTNEAYKIIASGKLVIHFRAAKDAPANIRPGSHPKWRKKEQKPNMLRRSSARILEKITLCFASSSEFKSFGNDRIHPAMSRGVVSEKITQDIEKNVEVISRADLSNGDKLRCCHASAVFLQWARTDRGFRFIHL